MRWNVPQESAALKRIYQEIDSANGDGVTLTKIVGMFTDKRAPEVRHLVWLEMANGRMEYGDDDPQFGCTARRV
jgi:hypothetical protein